VRFSRKRQTNLRRNLLRTGWAGLYGQLTRNCVIYGKGDTPSICWSVFLRKRCENHRNSVVGLHEETEWRRGSSVGN